MLLGPFIFTANPRKRLHRHLCPAGADHCPLPHKEILPYNNTDFAKQRGSEIETGAGKGSFDTRLKP
jgi:hypothetical protein